MKIFFVEVCVKNACHCLSAGVQVPGPLAIRWANSIVGRTDEIRLRWLGLLGTLTYHWQMTGPLSIFPVYRNGSPWQPVLCLWFRPRKTLIATSCDESRKSLKLQQKAFVCLLWRPLAVLFASSTEQTWAQHSCSCDCDLTDRLKRLQFTWQLQEANIERVGTLVTRSRIVFGRYLVRISASFSDILS